nr:MAG TPA: hypothetical protein [Caudoviricetes sp.]
MIVFQDTTILFISYFVKYKFQHIFNKVLFENL